MRKRDEQFADNLVAAAHEQGGLNDNALALAADRTYDPHFGAPPDRHREIMLRKAKAKLRKPDVRERIRAVFELADFTVVDAVAMHVAHIKGAPYEETLTLKDGSTATVKRKLPPSYQALKDFEAMVLEQPAKTVNVNNRNLNLSATVDRTPPMGARVLGAARVED